ncbi:FecR family protein [Sphingomonas hengshuiensis]|uniref:FecR protein domain-containing protein n=1 Tax=Sphingomonas hengshuiensis TaxID=1609977 RepID=A0A7U5BEF1_9SPHN|nr:FecR domain-containing protein [Sphingomonas hengshuiensis]AJP70777.1 hypothetical protein TS85_01485 [Sphingomonas hengshuiensis]
MAAITEPDPIKWEAAQWVERHMDNAPFDEAGFRSWLSGNPRCQPIFETMWQRVMGPDMDYALCDYGRRKSMARKRLASAAVVALLSLVSYQSLPSIELQLATPQTFEVADGAVRSITLPDGSRLTLGGGAKVNVRFTRSDRVVDFSQGAVFADVAHDSDRPFRIRTNGADIVDIGTSFEVLSKPSEVRVTVTEGEVELKHQGWFGTPVNLKASQAATLSGSSVSRMKNVNLSDVARWRDDWVEYRGTPLRQVIDDLQSLSPLPIEIEGDRLANQPVSGRIKLSRPSEQLDNLAVIQSFRIDRTSHALILREE